MPGLVPGIHVFSVKREQDVDGRGKPGHDESQPYLAQIDALAELRLDRLAGPAGRLDLDRVGAGAFIEPVELEIPVVVARRLSHRLAALHQPDFGALDAVDGAALLGRQRAADEAGRI